MKIPEKAPDWLAIVSSPEKFKIILDSIKNNSLSEWISKVEQRDDYTYWDTFKHLTIAGDLSPELAWAYLKFTRQPKLIKTDLISKEAEKFGYWISDSILRKLSYIDQHTSGHILIGDPNIHRTQQKKYLVNSLMEEAIASSQLEGAATTRKVAKEMLQSGRKPKSNPEQMIYNNYQTISKIQELTQEPLDDKLLLNLHRTITKHTLEDPSACGRFRNATDEAIHVKDEENQILYEPPFPDNISKMIEILYNYANDESKFTHPVIKAINLHFYLSYIHPFMDGNGRTARALFYWYMLKKGYWLFEYLTISRVFLKAPARYARAFLYTEIDELDLTYFISFHLRTITIAIKKLIEYIKKKQEQAKNTAFYLRKYPDLNDRQKDLLRHAVENPDDTYTINVHQSINDITYESARKDLLDLEKRKFLIRTKKGKEFCYIPVENLSNKLKRK